MDIKLGEVAIVERRYFELEVTHATSGKFGLGVVNSMGALGVFLLSDIF